MKSTTLTLGEAAPDFALPAADGGRWRLVDGRGGALVLVFYRGHW